MKKNSRILITGARGMVGKALIQYLKLKGYNNLFIPDKKKLDLTNKSKVNFYFKKYKPEYVFMLAAKVGGIGANSKDQIGFLETNLKIQMNTYEACYNNKVKKNLFLGSSCVYPTNSPQPIKEEYLLTNKFEPTNEGYALAKVVGLKMAQYYYNKYGMLTVTPMAANIYGTNDSFDLENSHVLSALVRRFVDSKIKKLKEVKLWGTGIARREFIHVSDVARALVFLMKKYNSSEIINLGTGNDISVKELAILIKNKINYEGRIKWDKSKPNGMLKKCLDIRKLSKLKFKSKISLDEGIDKTIHEYIQIAKNNA
tara:strand:- start:12181 stop:13119 length:939 start_codon:yes stop_codon:yes gene_type:complete